MKKIKIQKKIEKLDETLEIISMLVEDEYDIDINESDETLELNYKESIDTEEELDLREQIELINQNLKFSKDNLELLNVEELIQKWKVVKKENILKNQNKNTVSFLMYISKFYENKKALQDIIGSYSFIQFLLFFYRHKDLEKGEELIKVCNIIRSDNINFKMKLDKGTEENEYILSSRIDSDWDITSYEVDVMSIFKIPSNTQCSFNIELTGKYIYNEKLEYMKIELKISSKNLVNYIKTIEIV